MKHFHKQWTSRPVVGWTLLAAVGFLVFGTSMLTGSGDVPTTAATVISTAAVANAESGSIVDASKVMGYKTCITCHKSEVISWMKTKHNTSVGKISEFAGTVKKYCDALGITKEQLSGSICAECHATPKSSGGKTKIDSGVSCESCHSPSGSEQGWLNRHAVYGPMGTPPGEETPKHLAKRVKLCEEAGMVRAASPYSIAKNCQSCHSVMDEALVDAGHKAGSEGFELVGWTNGEVRHNFHQDRSANAASPSLLKWRTGADAANRKRVMYLVGLIVDIETKLHALSKVKEGEGAFVESFQEGLGGSVEIIQEVFGEAFEDEVPEYLAALSEEGELTEQIVELVDDGDFTEAESRETAAKLAGEVAKIAKTVAKLKGSEEELEALGEFVEENIEARGEAFSF